MGLAVDLALALPLPEQLALPEGWGVIQARRSQGGRVGWALRSRGLARSPEELLKLRGF